MPASKHANAETILHTLSTCASLTASARSALADAALLPEEERVQVAERLDYYVQRDIMDFSPVDIANVGDSAAQERGDPAATPVPGSTLAIYKGRAELITETARFIFDVKGETASLPIKTFANKCFGKSVFCFSSPDNPPQAPLQAYADTVILMHSLERDVYSLLESLRTVINLRDLPELLERARSRNLIERIFIAERLQEQFLRAERETDAEGVEKKRLEAMQCPASSAGCLIHTNTLAFISETLGDRMALFPRLLAKNTAKHLNCVMADEYIKIFYDTYETTKNWPQIVAAEKARQQAEERKAAIAAATDFAAAQRNELKSLLPKRPALKRNNHVP